MTPFEEALSGMPLRELRQLVSAAERQLYDRRCMSRLNGGGACTAEPPHADGWHECEIAANAVANPAHSSTPVRAVVRWRFAEDVVALEQEYEAGRRPGAN